MKKQIYIASGFKLIVSASIVKYLSSYTKSGDCGQTHTGPTYKYAYIPAWVYTVSLTNILSCIYIYIWHPSTIKPKTDITSYKLDFIFSGGSHSRCKHGTSHTS